MMIIVLLASLQQIEKVDIMGKDRYLVAHSPETILLGDMSSCKLSEVINEFLVSSTDLISACCPDCVARHWREREVLFRE